MPFALQLVEGQAFGIKCYRYIPFMVRQAVRVLLGRTPLAATAYLRMHHERNNLTSFGAFISLHFRQPQRIPAFMSQLAHGFDVLFKYLFGFRKCGHRLVDAVFAQYVQSRVGRAVGVVGDVVQLGIQRIDIADACWRLAVRPPDRHLPVPHRPQPENRCSRESRSSTCGWISRVVSIASGLDSANTSNSRSTSASNSSGVCAALTT